MNAIYQHLLKQISDQISLINHSLDIISNSGEIQKGNKNLIDLQDSLNNQLIEATKLQKSVYNLTHTEENIFLEKEAIHIWNTCLKCSCGKKLDHTDDFENHQSVQGHYGKMIGLVSYDSLDNFKKSYIKDKI